MNRALFQPPGVSSNDNRRVLVVSDSGESRQRIRAALTKNEVEFRLYRKFGAAVIGRCE